MTAWMLMSTLFAAEPAKTPPTKVYVVYVTIVEVDAEGNETVLFTPKVQTTGNPAGVAVEHVDGRTFEFNCKMAASTEPALEQPPTVATKRPFLLTVGSTERKSPKPGLGLDQPGFPIHGEGARGESPANQSLSRAESVKRSLLFPNPLPRSGGEGTNPKAVARPMEEYSVRTYDVSALVEPPDDNPLTDAHFAPVIQTIKAFAEVETWEGPAAIKPFTSTKSLVIKQTAAGHAAVAEALSRLKSDK